MAEYRGIADGKVELHKENGHTIFVPISKLSHDSKKFLQTISGNAVLKEQVQKVVPVIPATPIVSKTPKQNVAAENYSYNGFDWKAWLVKAGVSPYDASTYAAKFVQQNLDESILEDVDKETLRAMQISEGDIIRIRRATKLPKMTASVVETVQRNENVAELKNLERLYRDMSIKQQPVNTRNQIVEDEMLARRLQEEENSRGSVAARKVSQYSSVDAGKILEAGNILQAAKNPAKNATQGSASRQPTISSPVNPSNDPWTTFAGTSLPTKEQEAIKRQQQETAKTLETARMAMEKANEQLAKAKLLEEQSKANQSEMALKQAQETARAALLMQQQAAQKLMSAQMSAAYKPTQPVVALPPPLIPTNPAVQNYIQSTQIRPLVNPMLNQPVMGVSVMNPNMLSMGAQMQAGTSIPSHGGAQLQYMGQPNTPSMVTSQGVQKPSWNQASILL